MTKTNTETLLQTVVLRASALIGGKLIQDGLLFLLLIWLARINQEGYGLILFGFSIVSLLRSLQGMGLDQYALRDLSTRGSVSRSILWQMSKIKILIG